MKTKLRLYKSVYSSIHYNQDGLISSTHTFHKIALLKPEGDVMPFTISDETMIDGQKFGIILCSKKGAEFMASTMKIIYVCLNTQNKIYV